MALAYAVALGYPDRSMISAGEMASRHDFGLRLVGLGRGAAWAPPNTGADRMRDWHVTGSVLGLDVRLADFSLLRLSARPPSRKPTLNDADRRAFIEAVAIVRPLALTDGDRDAIVAGLRTGRERLAAARTATDADALAQEIRLGPIARTVLAWTVVHDPDRRAAFLSPRELLWLGLSGGSHDGRLHAWGAPAEPRVGCVCLRLDGPRPADLLTGRWDTAIFASGFPDLNLRLAELLAELGMPALLLAPVLASATLDFVNTVHSRDPDDRRGLASFVQGLSDERLEQYLALLTTDGPLVPVDGSESSENGQGAMAAGGRQ
jgi:hypothetical protein